MQSNALITLTSDFGTNDTYAAVLKGVILGINPTARIIDLTHDIQAQQINQAAYIFYTGYRYFPDATTHVVIVDPGVGSQRKAIVLRSPKATFVAPDNGVLSYVWLDLLAEFGREALQLIELNKPQWWLNSVSATFHGRDIFAPVAAHLTNGVELEELGTPLDQPVLLNLPEPRRRRDGWWDGRVIHIDHFGNCITNFSADFIQQHGGIAQIAIFDQRISQICRTYMDTEVGSAIGLLGSNNRLELAVRNGNAAQMMGVGVGDAIRVKMNESSA